MPAAACSAVARTAAIGDACAAIIAGGTTGAITREDTAGAITAAALVRRVGASRMEFASRIAATEITSGAALVGGLFLISS